MKNVKLTLATALSVMAMTFTTTAFADSGNRQNNWKQTTVSKVQTSNNVNRQAIKKVNKTTTVERVVVKNTPTKKVIITKTIIKKPAPVRYASQKHFDGRAKYANYNKRARFVAPHRSAVYKVRAGDTLFRISLNTGVNLERLVRLNHLRGSLSYLQIGKVLRLS